MYIQCMRSRYNDVQCTLYNQLTCDEVYGFTKETGLKTGFREITEEKNLMYLKILFTFLMFLISTSNPIFFLNINLTFLSWKFRRWRSDGSSLRFSSCILDKYILLKLSNQIKAFHRPLRFSSGNGILDKYILLKLSNQIKAFHCPLRFSSGFLDKYILLKLSNQIKTLHCPRQNTECFLSVQNLIAESSLNT